MNLHERSPRETTTVDQVAWSVQSADGTLVAVCSQRHGQGLWVSRCEEEPDLVLRQSATTPVDTCVHCGFCGDLVAAPRWCHLHRPDACPAYDALAMDRVKRAVALVAARAGGDALTEHFWRYLPAVARAARERGELRPAALAARLWDLRALWHPEARPEH